MDTLLNVRIVCSSMELRNGDPFLRASEFGRFDADITIACKDTGQTKLYTCSAVNANCYGWRHFRTEWIRQFGNP
jgi:hypothetical protein